MQNGYSDSQNSFSLFLVVVQLSQSNVAVSSTERGSGTYWQNLIWMMIEWKILIGVEILIVFITNFYLESRQQKNKSEAVS